VKLTPQTANNVATSAQQLGTSLVPGRSHFQYWMEWPENEAKSLLT